MYLPVLFPVSEILEGRTLSYSSVNINADHCVPGPVPDTGYTVVNQTGSALVWLISDRH